MVDTNMHFKNMCLDLMHLAMLCLVNTFLKGNGGGVDIGERDKKQEEGSEFENFVLGQCGREWLPGYQQKNELTSCYSKSLSSEVFSLVFEP